MLTYFFYLNEHTKRLIFILKQKTSETLKIIFLQNICKTWFLTLSINTVSFFLIKCNFMLNWKPKKIDKNDFLKLEDECWQRSPLFYFLEVYRSKNKRNERPTGWLVVFFIQWKFWWRITLFEKKSKFLINSHHYVLRWYAYFLMFAAVQQ